MKNAIKFAVAQSGYAVFGVGATRDEAIADAAKWMEPSEGGPRGSMTVSEVEEMIVSRPNDGDFYVIEASDEDFDYYLKNQGGFEQINGEWFSS